MFVSGWGGADSHLLGPAVEGTGGVILWVVPAVSPVWGESPLIPRTGPRFAKPILNGGLAGEWAGPEAWAQNCKTKMPRARPLSGVERGKRPGACGFGDSGGPVTNTTPNLGNQGGGNQVPPKSPPKGNDPDPSDD